jgi:hypothetical protein
MTFTSDELSLLNKGLKYNLGYKHRDLIATLALEAETAISQLPNTKQYYIRYQVAHNIRQLYKKHNDTQPSNTTQMIREKQTINKIKNKLLTNKAIIIKPTTVIQSSSRTMKITIIKFKISLLTITLLP